MDTALGFFTYWMNKLLKPSTQVDLYSIIQKFHDYHYDVNTQSSQSSQGAFIASFQGKKMDKSEDKKVKKEWKCLYGKIHNFSECLYIVEWKRPKDWKPDLEIQKRVEEKTKNPKLKAAIARARKGNK